MSEEGPRERWAIALTVGAILFVIYVLFAFKHFISMGLIVSNYTAVQLEAMILSNRHYARGRTSGHGVFSVVDPARIQADGLSRRYYGTSI